MLLSPYLEAKELRASLAPRSFYVYAITNIVTGVRYVGHTYRPAYRWYSHQRELRLGKHQSPHFQRAWTKYGLDAFSFSILHKLDELACAVKAEQAEIDAMPNYNNSPAAASCAGVKRTQEVREKLGVWQRGVPKSAEHKAKISATLTGRKRDPEATRKQAEKMRLVDRTPEWTQKITKATRARLNTPKLSAFGREQYLSEWAVEFGIHYFTLKNRVYRSKMPLEVALVVPLHRGVNRKNATNPDFAVGGRFYLREAA